MADVSTVKTDISEKEEASINDLRKKMTETQVTDNGVKKSAWKMTMETFGMADGKNKDSDFTTNDVSVGLAKLKEKIPDTGGMWDFPVTPFDTLSIDEEDFLKSFVLWSNKVDEDEEGEPLYNIDKAFRRLESYASWMYEHKEDLAEAMTPESVAPAAQAWAMKVTHSEVTGHLMWWLDMGELDPKAIKEKLESRDSLRMMVWFSHIVMMDSHAQEHGMVIMEDMAKLGMWDSMTMVPMELGTKLDRLTIGSLPVKMKLMYIFHGARWMHVVMAIMKPFMSSKMRSRMIMVSDSQDKQKLMDEKFGRECVPKGFAGLKGSSITDIIFGKHLREQIENPNDETDC